VGKMTFVVEFEDGKEPAVHAGMKFRGGRITAAAWSDYRDDFFTIEQAAVIRDLIEEVNWRGDLSDEEASEIWKKFGLLTL